MLSNVPTTINQWAILMCWKPVILINASHDLSLILMVANGVPMVKKLVTSGYFNASWRSLQIGNQIL